MLSMKWILSVVALTKVHFMKAKFGIPPVCAAVALLLAGCGEDRDQGAAASNAPAELIEPGVSVGKVHAGMTVDQVRAQLGAPQLTTANALEYSKLGFAVMPGADGVVQIVMCGDVTGTRGPLVERFHGKTKEGIGLGSTRADLISVYGQPSADEKFPGDRESMKYDSLGITFSLEGSKVHHMIVRLRGSDTNAPPAQSIEVTR